MPTLGFYVTYGGGCRRLETDIDGNVVEFPYKTEDAVPCPHPGKHPHRGDDRKKWRGYGRAMTFDRERFHRRLRALIREQYGQGLLSLGGIADAMFEYSERTPLVKFLGDLMRVERPEPAMLRERRKRRTKKRRR